VRLFRRSEMWLAAPIIVTLGIGGCTGFPSATGSPSEPETAPSAGATILSPLDATYQYSDRPTFSIQYPSACARPENDSQSGVIDVNIIGCGPVRGFPARQGYTFSYAVVSFSAGSADPCGALRAVFIGSNVTAVRYTPALNDGVWRTCLFTHNGDRGIAWTQLIGHRVWLLFGKTIDQISVFNFVEPLFTAMRDSWHLRG
jgi:hypothetical protein